MSQSDTGDQQPRLDKIYTSQEAADRLRISTRAAIKLGRKHGTCSQVGRDYFFSEEDLLRLWTAIRVEPNRPSFEHRVVPAPWHTDDLLWLAAGPPVDVDRRVLKVLKWLGGQKNPMTHQRIPGAGETTVKLMLEKGVVETCGADDAGLPLIKISESGRDKVKIAEKWKAKRAARRALLGR